MQWINRQYPDIEPVVLGPVPNCNVIVHRLNQQIEGGCGTQIGSGQPIGKPIQKLPSIKPFIKAWLSEINCLQSTGIELIQRAEKLLDLEQDSAWYTFSNCLKQLYEDWRRLKHRLANALVNYNHISKVLYSHTQAAKSAFVEMVFRQRAES